MAAISSSDVSYSVNLAQGVISDKDKRYDVNISFGDGALTYPAGGIPLDKGKMGLPNDVQDLLMSDAMAADGYVYKFDQANLKIRIYQGDNNAVADGPLVELGGTDAPAATVLKCVAIGR